MADLTPDFQVCPSWGSIAESFHSLQSLSVSYFHVILSLPGPHFPSTCMSQAVLTAPLEHSTCHTSRAISPSEWGPDPQCQATQVADWTWWWQMSWGLTLQICLIIGLSFRCRHWRFGFVNGQVSLAWSIALCTQKLYMQPRVLKRGDVKRELVAAPWTSSRQFSHILWWKQWFIYLLVLLSPRHSHDWYLTSPRIKSRVLYIFFVSPRDKVVSTWGGTRG